MRGHIVDAIFSAMGSEPDIFFLSADMGINLIEKFGERYPERYANVGIAEQNLIGISAGLANLGYRPFAYTISNFIIHRCYEQIRNDICLHSYPVTLLGTSTGYDNAPLGPTHHSIDEWGALKAIHGIDIYCPSSTAYAAALVRFIINSGRPAYVRIPKGTFSWTNSVEHMVKLPGTCDHVLLVSYGGPVQLCLQAQHCNPALSLLVLNRLRPIDEEQLFTALEPHQRILVIEDHFGHSGLYGTLCEFVARRPIRGGLESLAPTNYVFDVGSSPDFFYKKFGMDVCAIIQKAGLPK